MPLKPITKIIRENQKGMVLVVGLLLTSVLMLLGTTAVIMSTTDLKISGNFRLSQEALYAAEGGAEYGRNRLAAALLVLGGDTGSVVPPSIDGFTFENTSSFLTLSGGVVEQPVTGHFSGLTAFCQRYIITSTARKNNTNARATVVYELEDQLIPLFQFGIFYDSILEMLPGANMTFSGGRIHSNSDIHMATNATLSVDSMITSAGNILRRRLDDPNAAVTGTVRIRDAAGNYQNLVLDSQTDPNWRANALATWNGRVKSATHGIGPINLPLPVAGQPIGILGTGTGSLYQKSGLRIINGVAYDKNNNVLNLAAGGNNPLIYLPSPPNPPNTPKTFRDGRENRTMSVVEIDINLLRQNTVAMAALNDPPAGGDRGILYVSSNNITNPALRLVNGDTLPDAGLSVVTNNPLYIRGNYNTANRPAGLFADAVTVLSGNWSDANSTLGIASRTATNTTVNAAIMAGNKNTAGSTYSGGVENFMRFLENWSGRTFSYSGSLACLWQSVQATGNWPGTGTVYNPPIRDWSYGISMGNLPPGTPRVRHLHRRAWRQVLN